VPPGGGAFCVPLYPIYISLVDAMHSLNNLSKGRITKREPRKVMLVMIPVVDRHIFCFSSTRDFHC
jgi:hypothetical protein